MKNEHIDLTEKDMQTEMHSIAQVIESGEFHNYSDEEKLAFAKRLAKIPGIVSVGEDERVASSNVIPEDKIVDCILSALEDDSIVMQKVNSDNLNEIIKKKANGEELTDLEEAILATVIERGPMPASVESFAFGIFDQVKRAMASGIPVKLENLCLGACRALASGRIFDESSSIHKYVQHDITTLDGVLDNAVDQFIDSLKSQVANKEILMLALIKAAERICAEEDFEFYDPTNDECDCCDCCGSCDECNCEEEDPRESLRD